HPTGYPTYLLLGHVAELLPVGTVAFRANLLSAVLVAAALGVAVLIAVRLGVRPVLAAAAALTLGGIGTVWAAATVAEVNPLHLLFAALLVHRALVWSDARRTPDLAIGGLLLGLGVGNHLLTLTIAPFLVAFVAWTGRRALAARPRLVAIAGGAVALGLAVYLYIPLRAAMDPPLAYNHPKAFDDVMWLVTGRQFRDQFDFLSSAGPGRAIAALPDLVALAASRAPLIVPVLGVAGLVVLVFARPAAAALLGSILVIGVYVWANYLRLEHYLLVPWLVIGIGVAVAFEWLARLVTRGARAGRTRGIGPAVVVAGGAILAVLVASANWGVMDRSADRSGNAYVDEVLAALPANTVLLSEWDVSTPLWYARLVDGRRPDVTVIDDSNIVYDGWGTREKAAASFVCDRPVFMLRLDEQALEPTRAMFRVEPVAGLRVAVGGPTATVTRTLYRILPGPGTACPG
ncbi:MAG TPA: DUF2723 domain-containing protein, partial [Candidatus Limnocylindrales bacterium]